MSDNGWWKYGGGAHVINWGFDDVYFVISFVNVYLQPV